MVEGLLQATPTLHVHCIEAAIEAAEQGPTAARERAEHWLGGQIAEVVASPIDRAVHRCWPGGDPELAPLLHQQWSDALDRALLDPGVMLAVTPLRLLTEPGGALDQLEARGLEVVGPHGKASDPD